MEPDFSARAVSGEIMTGASARPSPRPSDLDTVDAEFEVLLPEPAETQASWPGHAAAVAAPDTVRTGFETLLNPGASLQPKRQHGGPLFWSLGLCLVAAAFWTAGGHASLSGASGWQRQNALLALTDVTSRLDRTGAKPILLIDGRAGNKGEEATLMPPIEIRVAQQDGKVLRYNLGTSGRKLRGGEDFAFSARLDVPTNGVKTVSVTFAE